jgi:hypothetical protein
MPPPIEISFVATIDDYAELRVYSLRKTRAFWPFTILLSLPVPLVCLLVAPIFFASPDFRWLVVPLLAAGVLAATIIPIILPKALAQGVRNQTKNLDARGIIGRIELVLSEESLVVITSMTRSEVKWQDMQSVEEVADRTFIWLTGLFLLGLPRHGFDCDGDYFIARDYAMARVGR